MSNTLRRYTSRITHHVSRITGPVAVVAGLACTHASAAVQILGVQYQQDVPYNEFDCIWNDKSYPTNCPARALGCNVHVYLKNTGGGAVAINDVTVAGYSLADSLVENPTVHYARSIYFKWDNPPTAIFDAGEPVWYKGDPKTIPAGGVAQAVVRLRTPPVTASVAVGVVTSLGTVTTNITKDATAPALASIGYSYDLTKVYLHWRRPGAAGAPVSVWMDGTNVTGFTTTVSDPGLNFSASVIVLPAPIAPMSYHVFQGIYADGKIASASQRAWTNKFIYATYGTFVLGANYTVADWIAEASAHGFNNCQVQVGDVVGYMNTGAGEADCRARGFGYTSGDTTKFNATDPPIDPDMFFLEDEPDAEEANMERTFGSTQPGLFLPKGKSPMGILVMREIAVGESLRSLRPKTPTNVNLDGTFRQKNYYAWGQAMDVTQVDPYYQRRLSDVYWRDQNRIPLYQKATYIYAVAKATVTAAEPNPANILLYSCEWRCQDSGDCDEAYVGQVWPFPTPEARRIEVYYALAAGAKGLGYWWLKPGYPSNGLADQDNPGAPELWKELGLLGNEIKTVAPLLVTGHPVDLPLSPGPNVWARGLASGTDTLVLFVVNDRYTNDFAGCHYSAIANATVTATLPSWMQPSPMAFEVTAGGLKAVSASVNGSQLQLNLGTLALTKMIVVTKNVLLPAQVQEWYRQAVRGGVCSFAPEWCGNSVPAIVAQPQSQTVVVGVDATFAVAASGTPNPGYQWRFNGGNVAGATSNVFTRISAQPADAGGYSVVVSNSLGSVTSVVATLTVSTSGVAPFITTPPQSQTVDQGNHATFTVAAGGGQPLNYQWRFNSTDLVGATDTSYTRFNAQPAHAGAYSVVITNLAGAITSAPAALSVSVLCNPVSLANGAFETTNGTGVATGWTAYEVNAPTIKVWSIQTNLAPEGSKYQQIQAYNAAWTANAGVRQDVTGCAIGATYQIAGWYRSNSDNGRARVRVSPTASADWNTAVELNPVADYGSTAVWATFSGTVVATGTNMTLWLDGRTIGGTAGKVGCFDAVTVTCLGPIVPPLLEFKQQGTDLVFRWPTNYGNYGLIATTNLGAPWSGVTPSPTVVNGTNVVTNPISGERKFYRLMRP